MIKSRGSAHSNQVREFVLYDEGAELLDVYVGPNGVLTGSERVEQISQERLAQAARADETERRRQELARRSAAIRAEIAALQAQLTADTAEFERYEASADAGRASGVAVRALQGRERSGDQRPEEAPMTTESEDFSDAINDEGNAADGLPMYDLRLYVAGQSPRSVRALENLRKVCDEHLAGRYRVEVIDLLVNPALAGATRSSPYPRWSASCPSPSARSSETSPTPTACSSVSRCVRWAASSSDRGSRVRGGR